MHALQKELSSLDVYLPNFWQAFQSKNNAFYFVIGGVLLKCKDNGTLQPISYMSKALTMELRSYSIHDKEMYGIVTSCQHLRP